MRFQELLNDGQSFLNGIIQYIVDHDEVAFICIFHFHRGPLQAFAKALFRFRSTFNQPIFQLFHGRRADKNGHTRVAGHLLDPIRAADIDVQKHGIVLVDPLDFGEQCAVISPRVHFLVFDKISRLDVFQKFGFRNEVVVDPVFFVISGRDGWLPTWKR